MAFTEKRKADREKMAAALIAAMTEAGAVAPLVGQRDKRCGGVEIRIAGAGIYVDFDGASTQPDVHVCTWNTDRGVFFDPAIGYVNAYHFGKATRICHGFDRLVTVLRRDVERFKDGSGFMGEDHPLVVRMREQYVENGWPWPQRSGR